MRFSKRVSARSVIAFLLPDGLFYRAAQGRRHDELGLVAAAGLEELPLDQVVQDGAGREVKPSVIRQPGALAHSAPSKAGPRSRSQSGAGQRTIPSSLSAFIARQSSSSSSVFRGWSR